MYNKLGLSVYVSSFDTQRDMLEKFRGSGYYVFTSFHIQEELNEEYTTKAKEMCHWLKEAGYKIIGDVSPKTLQFFGFTDIKEFAKTMKLDVLRMDYGFSQKEVLEISKEYAISFNASTDGLETAKKIIDVGKKVFAMHNFYPRPETGLDDKLFSKLNDGLKEIGADPLVFIPGDEVLRGPIHEGLPTLEKHRKIPPYVAYLDLRINYNIEGIFVGDIKLSETQGKLIMDFINDGIISVPVDFAHEYQYLYNQVFTIRVDSPETIMRLQESREYSCDGDKKEPFNQIERVSGSITMDNKLYGRYSGEIQIVRNSLPQDDRVNVIGNILPEYLEVVHCIKNSKKIRFVKI